ncbi:nitrous oxide-stimulated promoter family protein [bacterium]|nr:nitrous oxide-stimulated promoter family protein [bacterium]
MQKVLRYKHTIRVMTRIYCCGHRHLTDDELCSDCRGFLDYALKRLELCPLSDDKPPCEDCSIHCYKKEQREAARIIMRYAGPRMLWRHPVLTFHYLRAKIKAKKKQ